MDNDTINGIKSLMKEAQESNNDWLNVARSANNDSKITFANKDPFIEDPEQKASRVGYLYKIWRIQEADEKTGKKEKKICIRCTVHTTIAGTTDGERKYMNVYALSENRTNWRGDIDKNITTCLNKEIEDNSFKLSRWLV